jgi:hypothetical protein
MSYQPILVACLLTSDREYPILELTDATQYHLLAFSSAKSVVFLLYMFLLEVMVLRLFGQVFKFFRLSNIMRGM